MKTAEEWHLEFERCEDAAGFVSTDDEQRIIRAIQADALEAAENAVNGKAYGDAVEAVRALIPTAPGTPPPGEPSKPKKETPGGEMDESGAMDTRGYTTKEVDQIRANAYRAGFANALEAATAGCRAREREVEHCADLGDLGTNPVTDVIMVIESLKPDAPPPAPPSPSEPHRKGDTGPT